METLLRFFQNLLGEIYYFFLKIHRGLVKAKRLPYPVVSVGNISSGGRGKTPFVIFLVNELKSMGFSPIVLSRGYRREGSGPVVLDSRNPDKNSWKESEVGDEPLEIAILTDVPVLVGSERCENARNFLAKKNSHDPKNCIFVLDDGFQHWNLSRDVDIVLVKESDYQSALLPLGRMREKPEALARAQFVFQVDKDFSKKITSAKDIVLSNQEMFYLTCRADPEGDFKQFQKDLPGLVWLRFSDHESSSVVKAKVSQLKKGSILFVGTKEATKLLGEVELRQLIDQGSFDYNQSGVRLVYLRCEIELKEKAHFFENLKKLIQ